MHGRPSFLLDAPLPAGPPSIPGRGASPVSQPGGTPFRPYGPGRLHGCQVETEAFSSLRPPQVPPAHTLSWRPSFARTPRPAFHAGQQTYLVVAVAAAAAAASAAAVTRSRARPVAPLRPPSPLPRDCCCRRRRRRSERPGPPPAEMAERIRAGRTKQGQGGAWGRPNASGKSQTYSRGIGE